MRSYRRKWTRWLLVLCFYLEVLSSLGNPTRKFPKVVFLTESSWRFLQRFWISHFYYFGRFLVLCPSYLTPPALRRNFKRVEETCSLPQLLSSTRGIQTMDSPFDGSFLGKSCWALHLVILTQLSIFSHSVSYSRRKKFFPLGFKPYSLSWFEQQLKLYIFHESFFKEMGMKKQFLSSLNFDLS